MTSVSESKVFKPSKPLSKRTIIVLSSICGIILVALAYGLSISGPHPFGQPATSTRSIDLCETEWQGAKHDAVNASWSHDDYIRECQAQEARLNTKP